MARSATLVAALVGALKPPSTGPASASSETLIRDETEAVASAAAALANLMLDHVAAAAAAAAGAPQLLAALLPESVAAGRATCAGASASSSGEMRLLLAQRAAAAAARAIRAPGAVQTFLSAGGVAKLLVRPTSSLPVIAAPFGHVPRILIGSARLSPVSAGAAGGGDRGRPPVGRARRRCGCRCSRARRLRGRLT